MSTAVNPNSTQLEYDIEQEQPVAREPNSNRLIIVGVILIALVVLFRDNIARVTGIGSENVELKEEIANLQAKLDELNSAKQLRNQEQVINETKLDDIRAAANRAFSAIDELGNRKDDWNRSVLDIQSSEKGRRIAGDLVLVEAYLACLEQANIDPKLAQELKDKVNKLVAPLDEAVLSGTIATPNPALLPEIESAFRRAQDAVAQFQSLRDQLNSIVQRAPASPATGTLEDAIAIVKNKWNEQEAELTRLAVAKARAEGAEIIAQAQAEKQRVRDAEEAERIRQQARNQEVELEKQRLAFDAQLEMQRVKNKEAADQVLAQAAAREAQIDKDKAHALALQEFEKELSLINRYLPCVTTPSYTQLHGEWFHGVSKKQPVSFSALTASGCLTDDTKGIVNLAEIVGNSYRKNDRPSTIPPYAAGKISAGDSHAIETTRMIQRLIVKHAPILIEKGMLAQ